MNKINTLVRLILCFILLTVLNSCKKNSDTDEVRGDNCRIITIDPGNNIYNLKYNNDDKVDSITFKESGQNKVILFKYSDPKFHPEDSIYIIFPEAYNPKRIDYNLNFNNIGGLASSKESYPNLAEDGSDIINYNYVDTQLVSSFFFNTKTNIKSTTVYTWSDGNLITATTGNSTVFYTYYTDQLYRDGDYTYVAQYIPFLSYEFTRLTVRNKNLLKSISYGAINKSIHYTFDSDKKIVSINCLEDPEINYHFTYECF